MTAITFQNGKMNKLATLAKRITESLKSFSVHLVAAPKPRLLDPQALWDMGVTPEAVEFKLRQPAWRHIGRYL